jgi:hypothetical protein
LHLILALGAKRQLGLGHALAIDRRQSFDHATDGNGFDNRDLNLQLITGKNWFEKTHFGSAEEEESIGIVERSAFRLSALTK